MKGFTISLVDDTEQKHFSEDIKPPGKYFYLKITFT